MTAIGQPYRAVPASTLPQVPARLRLTLVLAGVLSLLAIGAVLAFGRDDGADRGTTPTGLKGGLRPDTIPPIDFDLDDERGRPVRLADLRGEPAVVTFQYTTCEDTCPITTQQIKGALDDLGHDIPVIAVSVDPKNDTVANARRFLDRQRMTGRMRWVLGDEGRLQRLWRAFGVQPQTEDLEHSASTVLLDGQGRQRAGYALEGLTPEILAHDIAALEGESADADSRENL